MTLSPEELAALDEVAAARGTSRSVAVGQLAVEASEPEEDDDDAVVGIAVRRPAGVALSAKVYVAGDGRRLVEIGRPGRGAAQPEARHVGALIGALEACGVGLAEQHRVARVACDGLVAHPAAVVARPDAWTEATAAEVAAVHRGDAAELEEARSAGVARAPCGKTPR